VGRRRVTDAARTPGSPHPVRLARGVAEELRGFLALGVSHVALEVSYSTYPAILETIELIADQIRPAPTHALRPGETAVRRSSTRPRRVQNPSGICPLSRKGTHRLHCCTLKLLIGNEVGAPH
jgi:hypothetical protein